MGSAGSAGSSPPSWWPRLGGLAVWWFTKPEPAPDPGGVGVTTVPTILRPISTTTTGAAGSEIMCPPAEGDAQWSTFKATPARTGCMEAPAIAGPSIVWAAKVGVQGWLNNPVIVGGTVYVASAGDVQFESDAADGVYAIDLGAGTRRWFFPGSFDVNGVAANEDIVVATGDEGLVWGIDADEGLALWTANLGVAVFTNPLLLEDVVVVGDASGTVSAFDLETGQRQWRTTVTGAIRGGAAYDGEQLYVVGEGREVAALDPAGRVLWRQTIAPRSGEGSNLKVFAAPVVAGDLVVISLVREEVFSEPGLVALDRQTGEVAWWATDAAGIKSEWGSVRSSPAVVGNLLVYGEGYSNSLVAVGVDDGETRWAAETGPLCYPHWSSPAVVSGQVTCPASMGRSTPSIWRPRPSPGRSTWARRTAMGPSPSTCPASTGLSTPWTWAPRPWPGRSTWARRTATAPLPPDFDASFCEWQPRTGTSILASPAVAANGVVVVGTLEGYLFAIGDTG